MLHAQEGNPEEFGKKVNNTEIDNVEVSQQEPENPNVDNEESGSLKPAKDGKSSLKITTNSSNSLNQKDTKKDSGTQTSPKAKKYNILLYYFYKSKYEETETKEENN